MITSVLLDGELGSGKTLSAVALAYRWAMMAKVPLLSNMTLEKITKKKEIVIQPEKIACHKDWNKIVSYRERGSVLLLDEAQSVLDSRTSMTKGQVKFTEFLAYLRKMRCVVIFTTPSMDLVDVRVRQRLTYWYHVSKVGNNIGWDIYDAYTGEFKTSKVIKLEFMKQIYNLYDTYELIQPVELPTDLTDFLKV